MTERLSTHIYTAYKRPTSDYIFTKNECKGMECKGMEKVFYVYEHYKKGGL